MIGGGAEQRKKCTFIKINAMGAEMGLFPLKPDFSCLQSKSPH